VGGAEIVEVSRLELQGEPLAHDPYRVDGVDQSVGGRVEQGAILLIDHVPLPSVLVIAYTISQTFSKYHHGRTELPGCPRFGSRLAAASGRIKRAAGDPSGRS
jgi:hypothetical protein